MGKAKKTTETRTKAAVGRERKLALTLVALRDAIEGHEPAFEMDPALVKADNEARTILTELGYSDLESIPKRVARLNDALKQAVEAGDGKLIAQLGLELDRAKQGLPPSKPKAAAAAASE